MRFWNGDGSEWVGNFQAGGSGLSEVVNWPEANAIAVIATDNLYLVDARDPADYVTLQGVVSGAILNEDRTKLFVAERYEVIAYGRDRTPVWQSKGLGGIVISISDTGGVLAVEVEEEMGEPFVTVRLSAKDGSCLGVQNDSSTLFSKPWMALRADSESAKFFEHEVARELAPGHSLYGRRLHTVAKNSTCDDLLFRLDDGTFAEVHLTFTPTPPERPGWPRYRTFENLADWMVASMRPEQIEHFRRHGSRSEGA